MPYTASYSNHDKNHPVVKALLKAGWDHFEVAYSSRSLSDYGWTIINTDKNNSDIFGEWLGFTIKDAVKEINENWNKKTHTNKKRHFFEGLNANKEG